jgi:N-methylhydantoinase B
MKPARDQQRVRDLTSEQFRERYDNDRFSATILASRMRYLVEHMCTGLMTNAFSQVLRDWYDFSATIVGPPHMNYPMSTVSNSMGAFVGHMAEAVRVTFEEYGPDEVEPGDVIIANDPYRVGNHVNDVAFNRPVFHDGEIIAFVSLKAHQLDIGGRIPGGFSAMTRNVFEGGLVLPPIALFKHDQPVRSTFNLIFDNSRFGSLLLPDIMTIYRQLLLGERLLLESVRRYGRDALHGAMRYSCDVSADAMRDAIRDKIPDGVYHAEEFLDADGLDDSREYRIAVTIAKRDDRLEIDLSGTSEQARTCINGGPLDAKSSIVVALKMLLDQETPLTSGCYRTIDLVIPPGTICSAIPPDGAVFLFSESSRAVLCAVYRALGDALGPEAIGGDYGTVLVHNGSGTRADGSPWLTVAQCGGEHGPWGATRAGDGDSYQVVHVGNNLDPATEAIEAEVPVVLLRKDYAVDSGGAGQNRGGAAVVKDVLWLEEAEHWLTPTRTKQATGIGANGGGDGPAQAVWLFEPEVYDIRNRGELIPLTDGVYAGSVAVAGMVDPDTHEPDQDGEFFYHGRVPAWQTRAHSTFRYVTGGGGGWGDPLTRDPQRVLADVRDEYVSIVAAAARYGVVVSGDPVDDPEGLVLETAATAALRAEMHGAR